MSSPWTVKATKGGSGESFDSPPAGNHPAVLVAVIDLGTHEDEYKGKPVTSRKVLLCWELTAEAKAGGGGNHVAGRDYNLWFSERAALRQMVEKWRGKAFTDDEEFDVTKLLGKSCLLSLVEKKSTNTGRVYAKIDGVSQLPRGMTCPAATIKPLNWWIDQGQPIPDLPWIPFVYGEPHKQIIERSEEWKARAGGNSTPAAAGVASGGDADESSIPF